MATRPEIKVQEAGGTKLISFILASFWCCNIKKSKRNEISGMKSLKMNALDIEKDYFFFQTIGFLLRAESVTLYCACNALMYKFMQGDICDSRTFARKISSR